MIALELNFKIVEMSLSVLSKWFMIEESMGPRQVQHSRQRALHPSTFHCCHLQDLFHVLVVSILIVLCVLQCAPGWDLLCQRNSVERELSIKERHDVSPLNALSLHTFTNLCSPTTTRCPRPVSNSLSSIQHCPDRTHHSGPPWRFLSRCPRCRLEPTSPKYQSQWHFSRPP